MTGGDILEITVNHPTLGSKTFFPVANQDNTIELGGFRTNDDVNMIDGGGNPIDQINRKQGSFQALISNDSAVNKELEFVAELAKDPLRGTWTITYIGGISYRGEGKPVGEYPLNINQSTFSLKVNAPEFKQI